MKTVIIDKPGAELSINNRQLVIETQGVPFRLIDLLVLSHDVRLSSATILKLAREDIGILMVSRNNA